MRKAIGSGIISEFVAIIFAQSFPGADPDKTTGVLVYPSYRVCDKAIFFRISFENKLLCGSLKYKKEKADYDGEPLFHVL